MNFFFSFAFNTKTLQFATCCLIFRGVFKKHRSDRKLPLLCMWFNHAKHTLFKPTRFLKSAQNSLTNSVQALFHMFSRLFCSLSMVTFFYTKTAKQGLLHSSHSKKKQMQQRCFNGEPTTETAKRSVLGKRCSWKLDYFLPVNLSSDDSFDSNGDTMLAFQLLYCKRSLRH